MRTRVLMMRWLKKAAGEPLAVSMSGIKLGDRLLVMGVSDIPLIIALAGKAGLTGRAVVFDDSQPRLQRAAAAIEREGVLVESFSAPLTTLPFESEAFDVVVVRNVLPAAPAESRAPAVAEVHRVIRPGGRAVVIDAHRGGLAGLFGGGSNREYQNSGAAPLLTAAGFRGVRTLAAREGLVFVEGVKAGSGTAVPD